MPRSKISKGLTAQVLVRSRRRCCICFGLHRDSATKEGQIAHLDRNNQNSDPDNLVFLCLTDHNLYDVRPSQAKGFTPEEVKHYRRELDRFLSEELKGHERLMRTPPAAKRKETPFEITPLHQKALSFFASPHRNVLALMTIFDHSQTAEEVNEVIAPHEIAWTTSILRDLVNEGWIAQEGGEATRFEITSEGRGMLAALAEIPRPIKEEAYNRVWSIS